MKTARQAAGDHVEIMIDIGKRYRLKEAMYVAKALEQLNIYWLEEPLAGRRLYRISKDSLNPPPCALPPVRKKAEDWLLPG